MGEERAYKKKKKQREERKNCREWDGKKEVRHQGRSEDEKKMLKCEIKEEKSEGRR